MISTETAGMTEETPKQPPKEVIPGLEGVPIAESAVSFVDGNAGKLEYRGINVEQLAEHSTFEETAYMLLFGELPKQGELNSFCQEMGKYRTLKYRIIDLIKTLPEHGHPMEALQAAVAAVGMFYSRGHAYDPSTRRESCLRLIAKIPTVVAAFERLRRGDDHVKPRTDLGHTANFLYMLRGAEADPRHVKILDAALILHADHTMNASTFAGRVVGSTLATPFAVVSSAMGALFGPLHGGANEDAMALFREIGTLKNVGPVLERLFASKIKIPGFGHRVYKTIDPRAKVLKHFAAELSEKAKTPWYEIALEVERIGIDRYGEKGIHPNVDFYSGIVYNALGFNADCFTSVFAVSRVAGWLAHWLEQTDNNRIFRPTQKYTGKREQTYKPIAGR